VTTDQLAAGPAAGNARTSAVQPAVEAWNVHKSYGRRIALRGVDLSVRPGRTLAIVGPNGAGKTTLLRLLATLARPSSGTVRICGVDVMADLVAARRHVGVVLATTFLYDELTGAENLAHYARLYGVRDAGQRAAHLAQMLGVHGRLHDRVGTYSRGMAQRLAIARALLHHPDVLLLDEPDAGLDPAATAALPTLLRCDGAPGRAIVLTCHDLHLALAVADDVAILAHGRFAFAAPTTSLTPAALRRAYESVAGTTL
jgi:ABC-type multidrug transport system ATPase subunit